LKENEGEEDKEKKEEKISKIMMHEKWRSQ
jgi:hypothetical protein